MLVLGIATATVVAFILSFAYYALAPAAPTDRSAPQERPQPWQVGVELLRSAVVSSLIAGLLLAAGWSGPVHGALLGLALWALPVALLSGSVLWEQVPVRAAALHAGDWLIKLVAIGVIVGLFT